MLLDHSLVRTGQAVAQVFGPIQNTEHYPWGSGQLWAALLEGASSETGEVPGLWEEIPA